MRILMLAWRDMKHPKGGGAEVVTDIYLKGLAKKGHDIILFSSLFKGARKEEEYDGYKIIRDGNQLGVYFHGLMYAFKHRNDFDFIIDQVNTIPFFTPLLIPKRKRIAFFHQLCLNVWFYESKLSVIGYLLENIYLKFYHNTPAFVVSESTKKDLVRYAWMNPKNILVLENQIDFEPVEEIPEKENAFCFCGRLKKSKRVHHCIEAMRYVKDAKLYVIGDGDEKYKKKLRRLVSKYGLENRVEFTGRVSFKKRNQLMQKCKAILVTSVREGWGLIVTEANANGTMAITYDIQGLRDANKNGIIVRKNQLPSAMKKVLNDPELMLDLSKKSLEFAKSHRDWQKNIDELEKWMKDP
jgi:glycosyltransferase involved in cell wall biosynthesis